MINQQQINRLIVANETTAITTNFRLNDFVTLIDTRRTYLCGGTEDTSESITLNNGRFLNPTDVGITRAEIPATDSNLTVPTATIDEFDFIFVEANATTVDITITIPNHNTTTQKVITVSRVGNFQVTVTGLTSDDIILNQEYDTVECRQVADGGSQWTPTLSYDLMDRVPHEWAEFNEWTSGEQHLTNQDGTQNTRVYGQEESSANITFGTVASDGTAKTTRATVGYIDTPTEQRLNLNSATDIEIGTLLAGQETRVENFTFPNLADAEEITMPTENGDNGDVMRVNASGVVRFDDGLTSTELLDIQVDDDYILTKSIADGRNNIRIRAVPKADGSNYTITNEAGINAWTKLTIIYDGSNTNGSITITPVSYAHGLNEIYLQKHGDYCVIEKTNSINGSFWTFMGGQCETDTTSDIVGLYSSTLYDRIRDQSVEESITEALSTVTTVKIPKSISDLGYTNGTDLTTTESEIVFSSALGIDVTVAEGDREVFKAGTNSGFAIFCSGDSSDPTDPSAVIGEIILPANQLTSNSEVWITRASSSGSNPRELWCYLGDATSGGIEIEPFIGETVHTPQNSSSLVGFKITADDSTLPDDDVHIYFSRQYIKDITLVSSEFASTVADLDNSRNIITNTTGSSNAVAVSDGSFIMSTTDSNDNTISALLVSDSKAVFANESSAPQTDNSLTSDITYTGTNKGLSLGDFATLNLSPAVPIDPDLNITITDANLTFTGNPGGFPELDGTAWNQSAQINTNYTEYTISNVQVGTRVQVFFTAFEVGDSTVRVDPSSGFTSSAIQTVTLTSGETPAEYNSTILTTNATTAVVRIRGNNVTPYYNVRFEVTQDYPVPPTADDSEIWGFSTTDKGFGLPTVDPANITTPSSGLLIRDNTDNNSVKQWDSTATAWVGFQSDAGDVSYDNTNTPAITSDNIQGAIEEQLNSFGAAGNRGGTTAITDINTIITNGIYTSSDSTNNPLGSSNAIIHHMNFNSNDAIQKGYVMDNAEAVPKEFIRYDDNSTWGEWMRIQNGYVRQVFSLTAAGNNPKWYRVMTAQATAQFKRDCTVITQDGSHSQASDFSFGIRARINDGRNDQDSRSSVTTMHMRNTTAFQYQNGSTVDTPIRAMRMVQEGDSDANRVVHIDLLMWQDSGSATCSINWQPSKYPEEDNGVILATVTEAPSLGANDTVEEYNLQGFLERNKDNYAVEFERSTGISSFVVPNFYNYQVSCTGGGNKRFETGSYVLTNPAPSVSRDGTGQYTIDFPSNTFPSDPVNVILHVSSNEGASSSTAISANAFMLDREKIRVAMSDGSSLSDVNFSVSVDWVRQ